MNRCYQTMVLGLLLACLGISARAELGRDWRLATSKAKWQGGIGHGVISFQGKVWVLGGGFQSPPSYEFKGCNNVLSSADGTTWTFSTAPWPARFGHTAIVYNGKMWIMGGLYSRDVWCSADGSSWTQVTSKAEWSGRHGHSSVIHNGKMWVIGGNQRDAWYSEDGAHWTSATLSAPWPARRFHASVVYDGKIWIFGGRTDSNSALSDVWYSEDGAHWTSATLSAPWGLGVYPTAFVHEGKMWIAGGLGKAALWYSTDGTSWTLVSPASAWVPEEGQKSVIHNGEIWVTKYDVWRSSDALNWTRAAPSIPRWLWRMSHTSLVYDKKLWIIGGKGEQDSVWCTDDGENWVLATLAPAFGTRYEHASCVHDGKMWVLGGWGSSGRKNDVWSSTDGQTWTLVSEGQFPAMNGCSAVSWHGQMYLAGYALGGSYLLSSADGKTWTRELVVESLPGLTLAVHRNRVFLFYEYQGQSPGKAGSFVCFDDKGVVEKSYGPTPARSYSQAFSFDGRLWVIGGQRRGYPLHDVWCSVDGEGWDLVWNLVTDRPPWWLRTKHTALPFLGRIFLMGGNICPDPELTEASDEIWVTDPAITAARDWWKY